jgi:DNA-binding CsgD family transcriptional regulator/tetratricopeptide (TPR) repeat protein
MVSPIDPPIVCPVIVGRAPLLVALDAHLAAARDGRGGTVVIAGEAGIGKSRLVTEVRTREAARDMLVLMGRCFEPDRILPYAPLLDMLRTLLTRQPADAIARDFAPVASDLATLLPDLPWHLPGIVPAAPLDPEREQHRLVLVFVQFITHLAATRPLLVVLEDLHWSDEASLAVLLALARRVKAHPILLLLTYRSDEITPSLRHLLAMLDRERLASEIALPRLTLLGVDGILRAIFGQKRPIRADFLEAIYNLTDGNPFFIEEVIRSLVLAGDIFRAGGTWERRALAQMQIPRSVQDAVVRRTARLSPQAATLLSLAAVAGRRFDFDVLRVLTGHDEERMLTLVSELVAAQLVVEESADRFAFRHALTRQAIYAAMLARERRRLHLAIANTIEQLYGDTSDAYLTDLAGHFAEGEAWAKAMDYGKRAGARALALYTLRAAVEHFSRAIEAAAHLSITPSLDLHRDRGRALAILGEFDAARADDEMALALAQQGADRLAAWQALLDLGGLWAGHDYTRAGSYFEQALASARALGNPLLVGESLTQLGGWYLNTERTDEAEQCLQDALAVFEQANDRLGIARTIDLLGTVRDIAGDIATMRQRYERAAALFRDLGDRQALSSTLATMLIPGGAYIFETVVVPPHIPAAQTLQEADESLSLAREIGWRAGEAYTLLNLALHFGAYGEYGPALDAARDGLAIAREIDHREWTAHGEWTHGMLFTDLLALERAHDHFGRAHTLGRASGSLHWLHITAAALAENHIALGDLSAAAAIVAETAPDLPMRTLGQRRIWLARAKLALAHGDVAGALSIVDHLIAAAAARTGEHDIPLLALLRGDCLLALGRFDDADGPVRATVRIATDRGLLPLRWRGHLALGRLSDARRHDADKHYQSARTTIAQVAASLPDGAFRDEFLAHTTELLPADRSPAARRDRNTFTLTAREREVVTLVARGLSNRDIADVLSIGERTAETHVGHILGKLGFGSRAEIAVWAARRAMRARRPDSTAP